MLPELDATDDERRQPCRTLGQIPQRGLRRLHERGADQQILRRVAGDREFRVGDEVGAGLGRTLGCLEDLRAVPLQVADRGVELRERDPERLHCFLLLVLREYAYPVRKVPSPW